MNALIELAALWATRPGLYATPEQVAAWYQAKGHVHEGLAADARTDAERITALSIAAGAYEHARRLLLDASPRSYGAEAVASVLDDSVHRVAVKAVTA
jgi:hypothetical protein